MLAQLSAAASELILRPLPSIQTTRLDLWQAGQSEYSSTVLTAHSLSQLRAPTVRVRRLRNSAFRHTIRSLVHPPCPPV